MNETGKYCIDKYTGTCVHLEIVCGGGWCHKDEVCDKCSQKEITQETSKLIQALFSGKYDGITIGELKNIFIEEGN